MLALLVFVSFNVLVGDCPLFVGLFPIYFCWNCFIQLQFTLELVIGRLFDFGEIFNFLYDVNNDPEIVLNLVAINFGSEIGENELEVGLGVDSEKIMFLTVLLENFGNPV